MEIWKPCPGFPNYEVSDEGEVRSLARAETYSYGPTETRTRVRKSRYLKPILQDTGYHHVGLHLNGTATIISVQRLVCLTFHGEPPPGRPFACHKDGTRTNNRASNLYWGSPAENFSDAVTHGTQGVGEKASASKLTNTQAAWIRAHYIPKTKMFGSNALAKKFGVHRTTIELIVAGKTFIDV